MKIPVKKTTCALMAGAVLMSMTGCSALEDITGKSSKDPSKEVLSAAEDYCKAIADADADSIIDLSAEDLGDLEEQLKDALDFRNGPYSDDMAGILDAIADTIEYEIDEDSLEVDEDKGEASVDVTFTVFDYLDGEFGDDVDTLDEAKDAIEDGDTTDIDITLELEETDDGWKVNDTEDITESVYEFMMMGAFSPDFSFDGAAEPSEAEINYDVNVSEVDPYETEPDYTSSYTDYDTDYDFELLMLSMGYWNTDEEMYMAFDEEYGYWEGTTSWTDMIGEYDSGVGSISFVQPTASDLGEICVTVIYSPVACANESDVTMIVYDVAYTATTDADGNLVYQVTIDAPADGYYTISFAPDESLISTPVLSVTARVGETAY